MTENYIILDAKRVSKDKDIVLVVWKKNNDCIEFSTHVIWIDGSSGLHHGNYYNSLNEAIEKMARIDEICESSNLPNKIDKDFVNSLLIKIRKEFYKL